MSHPQTCQTCGMAIELCPDFGGHLCSEGCPDQTCACVPEEREDA